MSEQFEVIIMVMHKMKIHVKIREVKNDKNCWHIENLSSVINYVAKEFQEEFKEKG